MLKKTQTSPSFNIVIEVKTFNRKSGSNNVRNLTLQLTRGLYTLTHLPIYQRLFDYWCSLDKLFLKKLLKKPYFKIETKLWLNTNIIVGLRAFIVHFIQVCHHSFGHLCHSESKKGYQRFHFSSNFHNFSVSDFFQMWPIDDQKTPDSQGRKIFHLRSLLIERVRGYSKVALLCH